MPSGLDSHGSVAPGDADEFLDGPACLGFDPVRDGQGCEHDGQVGFDGFAFVVVDRPGLQVVLGHPEGLLDAPQLVVRVDDELRSHGGEVGGVSLPPGQSTGFGFQIAVDRLRRAGELDEPVAFDRGVPIDGFLGFSDLLIDAAQRAPCSVVAVLVVDDPIRDAAGLLTAGGRPRLGERPPSGIAWSGCLSRHSRTTSGT